MADLAPICRQVVVRGTTTSAFEVFTTDIGLWWPVEDLSVYGKGAVVGFADGRLVEREPGGSEAVWGAVLDWDPPRRLRMTWHPGADPEKASEVEVKFAEVADDQTLVTVEHRGWERFADSAAGRAEYNRGWPRVLGAYADRAGRDNALAPGQDPVWLALLHTDGPALPDGETVLAQPDFAEHIAFLQRLNERGVLVAAGPVDLGGMASGMTVIRVPDPADAATYTRLAHEDDQAVVRGLLQVQVQPWHVALQGARMSSPIDRSPSDPVSAGLE